MKSLTFLRITYIFLTVAISASMNGKKEITETASGEFVLYERLTPEECNSLSQEGSSSIDFGDISSGLNVAQLADGRILAKDDSGCALFESRGDFDAYFEDALTKAAGWSILRNKNPYGEDFPNRTPALIKELANEFDLSVPSDLSQLSREVDEKLGSIDNPLERKRTNMRLFLNYIALVGEAALQKFKGEWRMFLDEEDEVTWSPVLFVRGQELRFAKYIYEDIYIEDEPSMELLRSTLETVVGIERMNIK